MNDNENFAAVKSQMEKEEIFLLGFVFLIHRLQR